MANGCNAFYHGPGMNDKDKTQMIIFQNSLIQLQEMIFDAQEGKLIDQEAFASIQNILEECRNHFPQPLWPFGTGKER